MEDCVFCKIIDKKIPGQIEAETEDLLVFKDINPQASVHLLIVPKEHVEDIRKDTGGYWTLIGKLAVKIAKDKGLDNFRLVHNTGEAAMVKHMHVHLLGEVEKDRDL